MRGHAHALLLGVACGRLGYDPSDARAEREPVHSTDASDWSALCVPGSCSAGHVCLRGTCVPYRPDRDGDGFDERIDCDEGSAQIGGPYAERFCEPGSACAEAGACTPCRQVCEGAEWGACEGARVGAECACEMGETDSAPCDRCGTGALSCVDGLWEPGACEGERACNVGELERAGSCGLCGFVTQLCESGCTWSEAVCLTFGVCATGTEAVEEDPTGCGGCGEVIKARVRERLCGEDCQWGGVESLVGLSVGDGVQPGAGRCARGEGRVPAVRIARAVRRVQPRELHVERARVERMRGAGSLRG